MFTNLLLADEINRTPPKTQAALLEAMQERQVSVDGTARPLPEPFIVVATQNPIEYEGTYPLPEAQLDRFLAKIDVGYPSAADESAMLRLAHRGVAPATLTDVQPVDHRRRSCSPRARRSTRPRSTTRSSTTSSRSCAAPRAAERDRSVQARAAAVHLLAAAKAAAWLAGRAFVIPDDVVAVAPAVLRHRITLRPEAELERYTRRRRGRGRDLDGTRPAMTTTTRAARRVPRRRDPRVGVARRGDRSRSRSWSCSRSSSTCRSRVIACGCGARCRG